MNENKYHNSDGPRDQEFDGHQNKRADELGDVIRLWRLWTFWGWLDVRQRYRRSLLGPFWVTATMAISVLATGIVYAFLFQQDVKEYLPYVATGFVLWSLVSGFIGESSSVFIQNEGFISQLKLPYLVYPLRLIWRYIIFFLHHAVVLALVLLIFVPLNLTGFIGALLGLALLCINIFWIGLLVGLASIKLRDIPMLVATVFQVLFLITPIIWPAKALGSRAVLAEVNPFYHLIESVRSPLLDTSAPIITHHLLVSIFMAVIGMGITLTIYFRCNRKILYWL